MVKQNSYFLYRWYSSQVSPILHLLFYNPNTRNFFLHLYLLKLIMLSIWIHYSSLRSHCHSICDFIKVQTRCQNHSNSGRLWVRTFYLQGLDGKEEGGRGFLSRSMSSRQLQPLWCLKHTNWGWGTFFRKNNAKLSTPVYLMLNFNKITLLKTYKIKNLKLLELLQGPCKGPHESERPWAQASLAFAQVGSDGQLPCWVGEWPQDTECWFHARVKCLCHSVL